MNTAPPSPGTTRRSFLRGSSSLFLLSSTGLLSACGDSANESPASDTGDTGPAELKFVGWEGYDGTPAKDFPEFESWRKKHGITLSSTYVADNEEMLTKIQASAAGSYDLTSPYHGTVPTMILAEAVEPIDVDKLTHWPAVYEYMRTQDFVRGDGDEIYAIPFTFSFGVGMYNADRVQPLDRFGEIFDDDSLDGRFALIDAPEQLTWIAKHLGFGAPDPHHITREELQECSELAREAVSKARKVSAGLGDLLQLMVSGEVDYAWTATADQPAAAREQGANVQSFLPAEGSQAFVDSFCIPRGSRNIDAALAWINEALSPRVQAEFANVYSGGVVNPEALPHLPDNLRDLFEYDNIETAFQRTPVLPPIPAKSEEFATYTDWVEAWNEAK